MMTGYQHILEILNPCLKRKGPSLWSGIFKYHFFDKTNITLNAVFFVSTALAIIVRLIFGSVLENTENGTTQNPGIVIIILICISLVTSLITFLRSFFSSDKEFQKRRKAAGSSQASKILGSILYRVYTLQESASLGRILGEDDKYKILENLAVHDTHELKFAENHFSNLEFTAKKNEDHTLGVFTAVLGGLTVTFFSVFSEGSIWDKLLQGLTVAFAINSFRYFYSRDSYVSRLRFCIHFLKQAQIMRTGTLDNWVREREMFDPGKMDNL